MEIIELIHAKQADFYIALTTTIFGVVLGVVIDVIRKRNRPDQAQGIQFSHNVTITQIKNIYKSSESKSSNVDEQSAAILVGVVLFVLGTFYLFFREEVLNSVLYTTILVLSIWGGGVLHSLVRGYFSGVKWFGYFAYLLTFCFACTLVVNKAFVPSYAPEYFTNSQTIINEYGIRGLGKLVSLLDIKWFVFHLVGVIGLFWAKSRVTLSTLHFVTVGNEIVSNSNARTAVAAKTSKYASFWGNILFVSILVFSSYYLVSGEFFMWFEYELPNKVENFINTVLNGRR